MYVFYLSFMLSFIIFNTDKHEFSSLWKWVSCCNDVMNHVDCIMKRRLPAENVFTFLKYPWYIKKNISWVILHGYSRSYVKVPYEFC